MADSEETELTPANDNPWYWLATLYGEQTGKQIDRELAKKNRIAWNRWIAVVVSEEQRKTLLEKGVTNDELTPFSDIEKKEHYAAVLKRSGRESVTLPEPSKRVDFQLNRFDHSCFFADYFFPIIVGFRSATFSGDANFESATFSGGADFGAATFSEDANFESATFSEIATFGSAIFGWRAYFRSTTFSGFAFFGRATFSGDANFGSATFSEDAIFSLATFSGDAHLALVTFRTNADFATAKFDLVADFVNSKFLSVTTFSKAVFHGAAPMFFGATLHEGTAWDGVEWPSPPHDRDDGKKKDAAQKQVYAYERLKQEMEKLKKHEDEQFFFRKELRARRELYTWRSTYYWLNFLYEKLSNYGYGVVRPLVAFAALFLVGFVLLALDPIGFAGKKLTMWDAAFTSLANMFGSLPLKTLANYTTDKTFAYSAEIFAIFQTIAGAVLLFLFFLALRNRFRLR